MGKGVISFPPSTKRSHLLTFSTTSFRRRIDPSCAFDFPSEQLLTFCCSMTFFFFLDRRILCQSAALRTIAFTQWFTP
ncbi:hypothetical protein BDV59DRAFT_166359 [Aspergillus ambiguus]|uniref:uncharacterized protein n=1 Tax=Aspergillus ambiguus TaxID=176160 RepID=UPI003CCD2903